MTTTSSSKPKRIGRRFPASLRGPRGHISSWPRLCLADPTSQIEAECEDRAMKQADVALTYALAIRDEGVVPVDWARANNAIRARWPKGLARVKRLAWALFTRGASS